MYFRAEGTGTWYHVIMSRDAACFSASLPKPKRDLLGRHVEYYVEADHRRLGSPRTPEYQALVVPAEGSCQGFVAKLAKAAPSAVFPALPAGIRSGRRVGRHGRHRGSGCRGRGRAAARWAPRAGRGLGSVHDRDGSSDAADPHHHAADVDHAAGGRGHARARVLGDAGQRAAAPHRALRRRARPASASTRRSSGTSATARPPPDPPCSTSTATRAASPPPSRARRGPRPEAARGSVSAAVAPVATASLSVKVGGSGSGAVTSSPAGIDCRSACSAPFALGSEVALKASPQADSKFTGWSGSCASAGSVGGSGGECVVKITGDVAVEAAFERVVVVPVQTFQLTVTRQGTSSTVVRSSPPGIECGGDCNERYPSGTQVSLALVGASVADFKEWGGDCSGSGACSVVMDRDRNVTASFSGPPTPSSTTTTTTTTTTMPPAPVALTVQLVGRAPAP